MKRIMKKLVIILAIISSIGAYVQAVSVDYACYKNGKETGIFPNESSCLENCQNGDCRPLVAEARARRGEIEMEMQQRWFQEQEEALRKQEQGK